MLEQPPWRYFSPEPAALAANKLVSLRQTFDRSYQNVHMAVAAATTKEHD